MLTALTVAVCLVAMRTQSDFWLGVLVSLLVAWFLMAVGALVSAQESRRRSFYAAFIVVTATSLLYGFGPWSDASVRGEFPQDANAVATYAGEIGPITKLLWAARFSVEPSSHSVIKTLARDGHVTAVIELTVPSNHSGGREQRLLDLARHVDDDIKFFSSPTSSYATRKVVIWESLSVFFDSGHILASLMLGVIAGLVVSVLHSLRIATPVEDRVEPDATPEGRS